jgi:DNA-binding NtrC family response regulator
VTETPGEIMTVGFEDMDRQILARAAKRFDCDLIAAGTVRDAIQILGRNIVPVIICQRDLPDGSWKDLLDLSTTWERPSKIIVVSRLADNRLWSEVLNLGAYDLLAAPLDEGEVLHVLGSAWYRSADEARSQAQAAETVKN